MNKELKDLVIEYIKHKNVFCGGGNSFSLFKCIREFNIIGQTELYYKIRDIINNYWNNYRKCPSVEYCLYELQR